MLALACTTISGEEEAVMMDGDGCEMVGVEEIECDEPVVRRFVMVGAERVGEDASLDDFKSDVSKGDADVPGVVGVVGVCKSICSVSDSLADLEVFGGPR